MHETRSVMRYLLISDDVDPSDEEIDPQLRAVSDWPYFDHVNTSEQATLDRAVEAFLEREPKERQFWQDFYSRVLAAIKSEGHAEVTIRASQTPASFLPRDTQGFNDWLRQQITKLGPQGSLQQKESRVLVSFPHLDDLKWGEVAIGFISKDSIKVTARDVSRKYTFAELGMKDGRKGDLPNTSCACYVTLLRTMAAWIGKTNSKEIQVARTKKNLRITRSPKTVNESCGRSIRALSRPQSLRHEVFAGS